MPIIQYLVVILLKLARNSFKNFSYFLFDMLLEKMFHSFCNLSSHRHVARTAYICPHVCSEQLAELSNAIFYFFL
jgi:hypothetical protein